MWDKFRKFLAKKLYPEIFIAYRVDKEQRYKLERLWKIIKKHSEANKCK